MDHVQKPGKGLAALLEELPEGVGGEVVQVPPDWIDRNPRQPRQEFEADALDELAASIERLGILHPLLVRRAKDTDRFELVCGERRLRAAQKVGLGTVPCLVADVPDERLLEFALVENLQRRDLNPIEVASAYRALMEECGYTQRELATRIGVSQTSIAQLLQLLSLPQGVQAMIERSIISPAHGRAISELPSDDVQCSLADRVAREGLGLRQTEREVQKLKRVRPRPRQRNRAEYLDEVERALRKRLGTKVLIQQTGPGWGRFVIQYHGEDEFERLLGFLS